MRLIVLFALCLSVWPVPAVSKSSSHSSSHTSHTSTSNKSNGGKTAHVNGYYRKDGTYIAPYDRHPAGTASHESANQSLYHAPYTKGRISNNGYTPDPPPVTYDKHGKIKRSETAKNEFKREHPCPANGNTSGQCPGYVIDHVKPLECGGADAPSNMQWQTVAEGKAKDKTERYCR